MTGLTVEGRNMSDGIGDVVSQDIAAEQVKPVEQLKNQERLFTQIEVNDMVRDRAAKAVEAERQRQQVANSQRQTEPAQSNHDEAYYRKLAAEETSRLRDEWVNEAKAKAQEAEVTRVANEFLSKVATGKDKYQDFDEVANVDFGRFPYSVHLANSVDNTADVVYELGKDRTKLAQLENLAERSPQDAMMQIKRMSQSLKDNEAAAKIRTPNAPLDRLRPSNAGTETGPRSVKDMRRNPMFRV